MYTVCKPETQSQIYFLYLIGFNNKISLNQAGF